MPDVDDLVNTLDGLRGKLSESDARFANDLINGKWGYRSRGFLSTRQLPWVVTLIKRAESGEKPQTKCAVDLTKVKEFLMNARQKLKFPKIWLRTKDGRDLKIYISGQKSRVPDAVNFKLYDAQEGWRDDTWLGRVLDNGDWHRPHTTKEEDIAAIEPLLVDLGNAPGQTAAAFGKLTGRCCFCNSRLSDQDKSTKVGYGPTCAKKWGLHDEWKAASKG